MKYDIETLARYVTGNCDDADRVDIEQLERKDPEIRSALAALRNQDQSIRSAFDAVLARPVPDTVTSLLDDAGTTADPAVAKTRRGSLRQIAASMALIATGAVLGYFMTGMDHGSTGDSWVTPVAEYQALYGRETLNTPDATPAQRTAMETRLTALSDIPVRIPSLDAFKMAFKRGQYLEIGGEPLIQLAWLPQSGRPLALCFKREAGSDTEPKRGSHAGLNLREWRHGGVAYVLLGEFDDTTLDPIARFVVESQRDAG